MSGKWRPQQLGRCFYTLILASKVVHYFQPEAMEQTVNVMEICDPMMLMRRHCNVLISNILTH